MNSALRFRGAKDRLRTQERANGSKPHTETNDATTTILIPLALTALLAFPQARADDEAETAPPKPDAATTLWESHAKTFDLDGDGRITWEEYQKVTSGFATLDADKDGAITKADVEALGTKLQGGLQGSHAAVFLGTPQGGFHQVFGGPQGGDANGLMRLLPFLLGGQGGPGMHGMPSMGGMGPMHGMPFGFGPWGGHGMGGGMLGGCRQPGCQTRTSMQILPWLFAGAESELAPGAPPAQEGEIATPLAEALGGLMPASLKRLVAFGLVAQTADEDADRALTRAEWTAGVKTLTKEDGSLDLSGLKKTAGIQGMPFPGGAAAILETLLDVNADGKVDAEDLQGVFEKLDTNGDGKVTEDELLPQGMGAFLGR